MREQPASANTRWPPRRGGAIALLAWALSAWQSIAFGQAQIRFPTQDTSAPSPTVDTPPATYPSYGSTAADGTAVPSPSSNANPFAAAPATAAPTLPPGGYDAGSAPAPGATIYSPAPVATLGAGQQPPTFDPYSAPGAVLGPVAAPDPYYANPQACPPPPQAEVFTLPPLFSESYRFVQDVSLDYHWFAGHGSSPNALGMNDVNAWATFALPLPHETPLLVTPGFAWHFWDGPSSNVTGDPDMPARTYDAYLQANWNPVFVPNAFSAELEASVGLYSDFTTITSQSIRLKGKGEAVIAIPETNLTLKAGVWYINRGYIKLLPAGGFVWKPSPYTEFDILFPNPKFTQMLYTAPGGTEWWWYFSGEYGGGVWTIKRAASATPPEEDRIDLVDYNDIRVALGIEFKRLAGHTGFFEGGYAFDRQLVYASGLPGMFDLNGTFYVHAGATF